MKLAVLACVVALAVATPRPNENAEVLVDERSDSGDGNFNYRFETSNGIYEERQGTPGIEGQTNMAGIIRFPLPDGTFVQFSYVADENGFQADPLSVFGIPSRTEPVASAAASHIPKPTSFSASKPILKPVVPVRPPKPFPRPPKPLVQALVKRPLTRQGVVFQ